jgi:hypothetical protein
MDTHSVLIFACILFIFIIHNKFDSQYRVLLYEVRDLELQLKILKESKTSEELFYENMDLKYELDLEKNKIVRQPLTQEEIDIMKG